MNVHHGTGVRTALTLYHLFGILQRFILQNIMYVILLVGNKDDHSVSCLLFG